MELSKKTTILLSPALHEQLTRRAKTAGVSLGELVRRACREEYGSASPESRQQAVQELAALRLPIADPGEMKRQSVPAPEEILSPSRLRGDRHAGKHDR